MTHLALVSVFCPDRTGLVAEIAGCLFDAGANLGDTTFAVLGSGAEFTAVCEMPDDISRGEIETALDRLPVLADAQVKVTPFTLAPRHGPEGKITHRITVRGGDRPGLIARLCEVFGEFQANIVRLNAEILSDSSYVVRFNVSLPPTRAEACLATVANTAEGLQLQCEWEENPEDGVTV